MYLDFFRLQREPFQVTPDPAFFYLSPGHREALAALIYGVDQRKGFIAITGEVGVGKTTILRAFLERIDREQTKVIYLLNASVAFEDLLNMLLQELGAEPESDSTFQRVNQFHRLLIELFRQDRNIVLVVDEAQNMSVGTLEGLRILSNLETATDKLLQIVFCGQPEFDEKLARPELRQLKQRIAVRAVVETLNKAEGMHYIQHRLFTAGVPDKAIFTHGAIRAILREAKGIPRLINILCDNALVTAFGYQVRSVKASIAKEIIADRKAQAHRRTPRWRRAAFGTATAAVLGGLFLIGLLTPLPRGGAGLGRGGGGRRQRCRRPTRCNAGSGRDTRGAAVTPVVEQVSAPSRIDIRSLVPDVQPGGYYSRANQAKIAKASEQHSEGRMVADQQSAVGTSHLCRSLYGKGERAAASDEGREVG